MHQNATQATTHTISSKVLDSDYLHRRKNSKYWYVRKRIPSELIGHADLLTKAGTAKKELTRSTNEISKSKAAVRADAILQEWEELFANLLGIRSNAVPLKSVDCSPYKFEGAYAKEAEELFNYAITLLVHKDAQSRTEVKAKRHDFIARNCDRLSDGALEVLSADITDAGYKDLLLFKAKQLYGGDPRAKVLAMSLYQYFKEGFGVTFGEVVSNYLDKRRAEGAVIPPEISRGFE